MQAAGSRGRSSALRSLVWCGALLALSGAAGCAHHAKLVTPDTAPASAYECGVETGCKPASVIDDAHLNQSGTAFLVLPKECHGYFQQIVLLDADTDRPTVVATCAAERGGVTTSAGPRSTDPLAADPLAADPVEATGGTIGEM